MARGSGQDNISMRSKKANGKGRWTLEEHGRFLEGVRLYGKNWDAIRALVPTRSAMQIRTHYSPKYAARKHKGPALQDEACDADTVVRSALEIQAKIVAANVRKADFLGSSAFAQAHLPHAHGIYDGMDSITRAQQLGSTQNVDKAWMVASSSGAISTGPAPEKCGRLTGRSHVPPAPTLMPTFNGATARGYGSAASTADIQTAPTVYRGRSSAHGVGHGNANAGHGTPKRKFEVADEDEDGSGMSASVRRPVGLPSEAWRVCKPECAAGMTAGTEEVDGIAECFFGADIFGVL